MMAIFKQTLPASLRSGSSFMHENRGQASPDRRPYLVTRKSVSTTQQYMALFPHESEDARITGTTRSLYRRLLALNLPGSDARDARIDTRIEVESSFVHESRTASVSFAGPKIA
jgi:hypothetical protein